MEWVLRSAPASPGWRTMPRWSSPNWLPAVLQWARGPMAALTGESLGDPRVDIREADVGDLIAAARSRYDAILLDVDNGPDGLGRSAMTGSTTGGGSRLRAGRLRRKDSWPCGRPRRTRRSRAASARPDSRWRKSWCAPTRAVAPGISSGSRLRPVRASPGAAEAVPRSSRSLFELRVRQVPRTSAATPRARNSVRPRGTGAREAQALEIRLPGIGM